jgi:CheY-like chemotaxis protein
MSKVLIVDDDKAIRELLTEHLESAGYEVGTCKDGKAALEELDRTDYQLLLLDVLIPHVNGFAVVEELSQDPKKSQIPTILFSGLYKSSQQAGEIAKYPQVVGFLDKPLETPKLLELVRRYASKDSPVSEAPAEPQAIESEAAPPPAEDYVENAVQSGLFRIQDVPGLIDSATKREVEEVEESARSDFRRKSQPLILQGSLASNALAEVFGKLYSEKATGGLLLRSGKVKKIVQFQDGNPVSVKSNLVSECLGQLLVRERIISQRELEASIRDMKSSGAKQGQVLIKMGSISQKNLDYGLALQFETKVLEPFAWEQGEYRFNSGFNVEDLGLKNVWPHGSIVIEGIRRHYNERRIAYLMQRFAPLTFDFANGVPEQLKKMKFATSEVELIKELPTPGTLRSWLELGRKKAEVMRTVYALVALRILKPLPPKS